MFFEHALAILGGGCAPNFGGFLVGHIRMRDLYQQDKIVYAGLLEEY
jgi:hypothetical protein